jgi:integrase
MADDLVPLDDDATSAPITRASGTATALTLLRTAELWANATTDPASPRRRDLIRDKVNALIHFFEFVARPPAQVTPEDVRAWQHALEAEGLSGQTVYGSISRVSSFYTWALGEPELARLLKANPVKLARPKAPKPYQSESIKALTEEEVLALLEVVHTKALNGNIIAKRDYALLLFYLLTGMRRREIIQLRWGDITLRRDGSLVLSTQVKGGTYIAREVADRSVGDALLDYLHASGRFADMQQSTPLWVAHDRAQPKEEDGRASQRAAHRAADKPLSSHGFVKNLLKYAKAAGIAHIHLHQTRHTFAALVGDESGSLLEVQDALGHRHAATTRVYLQRVAIKRDKHSTAIARRLGVRSQQRSGAGDE